MKVKFTPSARNQFLSALSYIQKDKPSAAINFCNRSEKILRRLEDFLESGRIVPEFPELPYREVIISPYRFFIKSKMKSYGLLRCGMARSFQKNQHPNANLKIQQTQNAAPLIKERVLNKFSTLLYPGARASRPHGRKYCKDVGQTPALPDI